MLQFTVPNMTCGGCASSVRRALADVPGVIDVRADPPSRCLTVEGNAEADAIARALADAGYEAILAA